MSDPQTPAAGSADAARHVEPAVFRVVPLTSLVAVAFVALGASTIAFLGRWWFTLLLVPVALAWVVVATHTTVDTAGLRVRRPWGSRRVSWSQVSTLRLVERGQVRLVGVDGAETALPGVRVRDLGRVGEASGGRITVPTPADAEAAAEHERELVAARMRIERLRAREGAAASATGAPTADIGPPAAEPPAAEAAGTDAAGTDAAGTDAAGTDGAAPEGSAASSAGVERDGPATAGGE